MAISSISATAISCSRNQHSRSYGFHSFKVSSFTSAHPFPLQLKPNNHDSILPISSSSLTSRIIPKVCRRSLPLLFLESVFGLSASVGAVFGSDASSVSAKKENLASLDELLHKSEKPVLVDFYATWCGPCQFMVPILEEVSGIMNDSIQVVKIDTEKHASSANQYGIKALPTFILFKDGKPVDRFEGALPRDKLIKRIETSLNVKQS
ncbi:Thioredoxin Y, chloroplastic [Linum grandiflorum]